MTSVDKSFGAHQGSAIDRQDYAYAAFCDHFGGLDFFSDFESDESDVNIDSKGIDARIGPRDEDNKFCALKTRSNAKRDFEYLDIGLRVAGRSGRKSEEWERFATMDKPVPDLLFFALFDVKSEGPEECVEMLIIDFKMLKEIYHLGRADTVNHDGLEVPIQKYGPIDVFGPVDAAYSKDDGVFMFLSKEDIVKTGAVLYHYKDW